MEERLIIHNFGPIQEADVRVRDLTIFVGPQATGKSLAAQALYFLANIGDLLSPNAKKPLEDALSALEWWFGNAPSVYAGPGTLLCWDPIGVGPVQGRMHEIRWDYEGPSISEALEQRVQEAWQTETWRASSEMRVYIPAGRALYSFLPPYSLFARSLDQLQWPGYIRKFYETLGRAVRQLWEKQEVALSEISPEKAPFLQQRIDSIIKGQIRYGPDAILLETNQKRLRPATIAAGQMEIWPFWAIVEAGLKSSSTFPPSSPITFSPPFTQVYFEEPESHLHPGAQRSVMEIVAALVQQGVRFLLTTHSPYILYAVNNFLMANKVQAAGRPLPQGVPPEVTLRPEQVAAYRFSSDGKVYDIMDAEVGLIDEDELDQAADELGAIFTHLQERLAGLT